MAEPQLMPVASRWLLLLLLLLLSGEPVPASNTEGFYEDPTGSPCSLIRQNPRFVAKKRGSNVKIQCQVKTEGLVEWLKQEGDQAPKLLTLDPLRIYQTNNQSIFALIIQGIQYQDNGIYFCRQTCPDKTSHVGCGTELRVMGFSTVAELRRRNMLKDGIIMIQTLLIIVFIVVPIFLLLDKDDGKPGMEEDHTYEGLNIDQTATYEDIVTLRTGEVKWSVGEHPGQE